MRSLTNCFRAYDSGSCGVVADACVSEDGVDLRDGEEARGGEAEGEELIFADYGRRWRWR